MFNPARLFTWIATLVLLSLPIIFGGIFFLFQNVWVDLSILEHYNVGTPSIILDEEGIELARFELDRRNPVNVELLPPHLIQAFISAEDHDFFSHAGISYKGIIRSALTNLYHRKIVQGASTITQQLVKLLFTNQQRTFFRKVKEQILALLVEHHCTKEQILQTYLNHTYFGCGIYGVEAASQRFWHKSARDITIDEAATLARIISCPGRYCPLINKERAEHGRNSVLYKMKNAGFISESVYQALRKEPLRLAEQQTTDEISHLKEKIRLFAEERFGKEALYTKGLIIQTTINKKKQRCAYETFSAHVGLWRNKLQSPVDGALVALDPSCGAVRALIGGYSFKESQFNRATNAHRQLGSLFKPLIYAEKIIQGGSFADTAIDEPLELSQGTSLWQPRNVNRRFDGEMTLARALARSNNIIAIKTLLEVGIAPVLKHAEACDIPTPAKAYPSLALGCLEATPVQAAGLFTIFANNGTYHKPYFIEWIKNAAGVKIYKHVPEKKVVFSSRIASQVGKILVSSLQKRSINIAPDIEAMGKTGTTNQARTCWFAGATPSLTTIVYIGHDDNSTTPQQLLAMQTSLPMWLAFNKKIEHPIKKFSWDPHLREITINEWLGHPTAPHNETSIRILQDTRERT